MKWIAAIVLSVLAVTAMAVTTGHYTQISDPLPTGTWDLKDSQGNTWFADVESTGNKLNFEPGTQSSHTFMDEPSTRYWNHVGYDIYGNRFGHSGSFVFLFDAPDIWWWYWYPIDGMEEPYASGPCLPN